MCIVTAPAPFNRKIILATVGSLGDLHPFLALARSLQRRGFEPVIASYAEYREKVETAGVRFYPIRPSIADLERDLGVDKAELVRRAIADQRYLFRKLVFPYLSMSYEDMTVAVDGAGLVLASSLAFTARFAAQKQSVPWIGIVLQPMLFLSAFDPPVLLGGEWFTSALRRIGPRAWTYILSLARRMLKYLCRPIDEFRASIGLPSNPLDPLIDGQFSDRGTIALYSCAFAAVQPDYPAQTSVVGFTWYDSEDGSRNGLEPELEAFLSSGAKPLVITFGSAVSESCESFFQESIRAARALGIRIVVLTGQTAFETLARETSADVCVAAYAPHSLLFAKAAAIIHHGGIGTLAQALRAGQPQLIVPFLADQADNAARAERLGVARILGRKRFRSARVAREIGLLLARDQYRTSAERLRRDLCGEDGAEAAAELIRGMVN
jgi:UDP:flavonoid glycosyltransferase YjiC (YdhE family)